MDDKIKDTAKEVGDLLSSITIRRTNETSWFRHPAMNYLLFILDSFDEMQIHRAVIKAIPEAVALLNREIWGIEESNSEDRAIDLGNWVNRGDDTLARRDSFNAHF